MNGAFYIGATGLQSQQRALEVVANNIANINTPAFKRSEIRFSELLAAARGPSGEAPTDMLAALAGTSAETTARVFAQGELRQTGRPLDLAIDGQGFIELLGPNGQTMLWRGGALKVNADGFLAADNGLVLKAMASVPRNATDLLIDRGGKITVSSDGVYTDIGQIDLVLANDATTLRPIGEGLYQTANAAGVISVAPGEDGGGSLVQGSLESSNVELSQEMVNLLLLQRAYTANAQVLQAGDQLMSIANNLKR